MIEDLRIMGLLDWLRHDLLMTITRCEPASSDASFRRYFRVEGPGGRFVVMDAPPEKENVAAFIKVNHFLKAATVHVPEIFAQNLEEGYLLLEDFGSVDFLDRVTADNAGAMYRDALDSLFRLQTRTSIASCGLPSYDHALLTRELGIFDEWFLGQRLDIEMPSDIRAALHERLIASALEQPRFCVHRDYHSRNLMALEANSPGVLDFQDAVIGPVTYDLVSLLRDCYIAWPEQQIEGWMSGYYRRLLAAQMIDCSLEQFRRWFDWMGMQRHLKAIGIFARLNLRDGKPGYLKDIPRTLNYVLAQVNAYPEFAEFGEFLREKVLPLQEVAA
ncbi:phosphotransferase [Methylomicrobium sp. Wu6]|uniref:aminoglycoside phosphotransferase family protein n=1 Tax=Methylomicrobium sp. Wu6 TaxID=3107928 RepID=UPI002DD64629|nr:phosphotransferase [Methylomicrobium sp. Wu6]MEC4748077.1 phosphotransferase [Methylomicrobium sp. Wu6]